MVNKHLKSFNFLAEAILIGLLVIIFAPIIIVILIFAIPLLAIESAWNWARKEPKPEIPEVIVDPTNIKTEEIVQKYITEAKNRLKNINVEHNEKSLEYALTSPELGSRKVTISYGVYGCYLAIDGLNSYEWSTGEGGSIDLFFWIAVGALRNGVHKTRSKLGRTNFWVKCDEMMVWSVIQREGSSVDSIYFYEEPAAKLHIS